MHYLKEMGLKSRQRLLRRHSDQVSGFPHAVTILSSTTNVKVSQARLRLNRKLIVRSKDLSNRRPSHVLRSFPFNLNEVQPGFRLADDVRELALMVCLSIQ